MRISDKKKNIKKVNILAESLYRQRNNTPSEEQGKMYDFIGRYVKDPDDIEFELRNYQANGFQGLSDYVQANLDRDMDFITYTQMTHDEDTFRRESGL